MAAFIPDIQPNFKSHKAKRGNNKNEKSGSSSRKGLIKRQPFTQNRCFENFAGPNRTENQRLVNIRKGKTCSEGDIQQNYYFLM